MVDGYFAESAWRVIGGNDISQGDEIGAVIAVPVIADVEESVGRGVPI